MKKNLLLLIISTLLFASCKKSVDEPAQSIQINFLKASLAYVQMPANKYYIYKDSATGDKDSVIVTESLLDKKFMPSQYINILGFPGTIPAYYYQTFTLILSKMNGSTSTDWFFGIASTNGDAGIYPRSADTANVSLLERDRSLNADKGYVFDLAPFVRSNLIIPSLTIEGKEFVDVVRFATTNGMAPSASGYRAVIYYWAKGIGIIKRSISTGNSTKTWTLVKNG